MNSCLITFFDLRPATSNHRLTDLNPLIGGCLLLLYLALKFLKFAEDLVVETYHLLVSTLQLLLEIIIFLLKSADLVDQH